MKKRLFAGTFGALILALGALGYSSSAGCASFGAAPTGARRERMEKTGRFVDGEFKNLEETAVMAEGNTASATIQFLLGNDELRAPTCALKPFEGGAAALKTPPASGLRITWLGHSSTVVEMDGRVIVTDPHWSERASPFQFAGPKRFHAPPLPLEALPKVDVVLISHDHYDHLDMRTVQALADRGAELHVALGVGAHLERWGIPPERLVEHDWWQEAPVGELKVVSTPARHFSGRGLLNRNGTLWTSWAIIGPKHRVYFSGDTGMTDSFKEIGQRYGPFDVGLYEVGQYHPSWGQIHLGPEGALDAHAKLGAKWFFPIHWATFELGLHAWNEPPETVVREGGKRGMAVLTPMLGEPVEPDNSPVTKPWWRAYPPLSSACPPGSEQVASKLDHAPRW